MAAARTGVVNAKTLAMCMNVCSSDVVAKLVHAHVRLSPPSSPPCGIPAAGRFHATGRGASGAGTVGPGRRASGETPRQPRTRPP